MNETTTYVLFHHGPNGEPIYFYVGEAVAPDVRFKQHQRDFRNPLTTKEAYLYLQEHGITEFFYAVLDGVTEAQAVEELTKAGHRIYNANKGVSTTVKKRKDHTFAKINRQAEEAIERRARLYNSAQNYSKSEVVRQRITGDYPSLEELLDARWTECPSALLSADVGRTGERAEYCKLGDISVFVAYKNKDRMLSVLARHRDGRECRLPKPLWYGPKALRETLLRNLVAEMSQPWGWEKVYTL